MDLQTAKLRSRARRAITHCTRCPLHSTCKSPVPFTGPTPTRVMVIGEAPGAEEDNLGRPFVGRAGQLLRRELSLHLIDPDEFLITNSVACRPPGNRTPANDELAACRPNLLAQMEIAQPRFVVLAGATALSTVRPDLKVSEVHGRPFVGMHLTQPLPNPYERLPVFFPIYHPAAALRAESVLNQFKADIASLAEILKSKRYLEAWPTSCVKCAVPEAIMSRWDLLTFCERHLPKTPGKVAYPPGAKPRQLEGFVA